MRSFFRVAATLAATTVASGTLIAGLAGTAHASTTPPWETGSPPSVSPNEVGGLTFYNSAGQVITGGSITDNPIAAYVQGNTALQANGTKAELTGYTPVVNVNPGAWNGVPFFNSAYPNASAPGALGTSHLPLYTGVSGYSISTLISQYANGDTTNDGYAGIYVLRLQAFQSPSGYSSTYDSADISVSGSTWSVVYSPQASTTTTLTVTPASPETSGTSVTLDAAVADVSAPGTVQFYNGATPIGSGPVTVSNGTASLTTTSLPVGSPDNLSAVFTPTAGAAFTGSTSNTVAYVINAPPADATSTALSVNPTSAPADTQVAITASVTDTATSASLNGGGSVTFYDNGADTSGNITGTSTSLGTVAVSPTGTALLDYSLFAQGAHDIVAKFTPTGAYDSSTSLNVPFTATQPLYAPDPQNLQAEIPAGTLTITTPYGPSNAFDLGTATLNPNGGEFTASKAFGSAVDPNAGVTITDTGVSSDWTASAQVTNFTGSGGAVINGQNLTFTGVTPSYLSGNAYAATGTGTIPVLTNDVTNSPPGGFPYGALATGTDGLFGEAHAFADTATPGGGEVNIFGQLTLNAPSSTPAGTYTATLTFTIA